MKSAKFKKNEAFMHKEQPVMMLVDDMTISNGEWLYTLKVMDTKSREVTWKRYPESKLKEVCIKVGSLNAQHVLYGK